MTNDKHALQVSLTSIPTVTQEQCRELYLKRSKERALELLGVGRIREAVASMIMDDRKAANCGAPHELHAIGIAAAATGDVALARAYIEGFN